MKTKLQFACQEDWNKMKVGLVSRHCEHCKKDVFDFTKLSRQEVLLYLLENRDKQVCARILPSQIDYHHEDLLITIEHLFAKHKNSNLAFYLLTIGSLTLLGCSNQTKIENSPIASSIEIDSSTVSPLVHSAKTKPPLNDSSIKDVPLIEYVASPEIEMPLLGVTIAVPENYIDDPLGLSEPQCIAQIMPEFVGGFDSLVSFMRRTIKYPDLEKKNSIEGTTYVSIVIDSTGKVNRPIILKSVSENFDSEALRVISLMPDWIPGENNGRKVQVRYVLPIKFKL
jgi:TonB family protein